MNGSVGAFGLGSTFCRIKFKDNSCTGELMCNFWLFEPKIKTESGVMSHLGLKNRCFRQLWMVLCPAWRPRGGHISACAANNLPTPNWRFFCQVKLYFPTKRQ
jgi:hypothetical protein